MSEETAELPHTSKETTEMSLRSNRQQQCMAFIIGQNIDVVHNCVNALQVHIINVQKALELLKANMEIVQENLNIFMNCS